MIQSIILLIHPQHVLVWTCVGIFVLTSLITLLGLVKLIKIEARFLNKLFAAIILEIAAIGVMAFRDSFKPAPIITTKDYVRIVMPQQGFQIGSLGNVSVLGAYSRAEHERLEGQVRTNEKTQSLALNFPGDNIFGATVDNRFLKTEGQAWIVFRILKNDSIVVADSISINH